MKTFGLCFRPTDWKRHGGRHPMGDDFAGYQDIIPQVLDEQTVLSYTADVPRVMLQGMPADRHA